ncbi:MAG TPA: Txe/YoeB family addiction module toxin [Chitinophagaceae bacterium]
MQIDFTQEPDRNLKFFIKSGGKQMLEKINSLIKAINETPFQGIGKPEPLQHRLAGLCSRRISQEHRLIYELTRNRILIYSLRGYCEK